MKAFNTGNICGSRGGYTMRVVELDQAAWEYLTERTEKGLAPDWVLIGKRPGKAGWLTKAEQPRVAIAAVEADRLERMINEGG